MEDGKSEGEGDDDNWKCNRLWGIPSDFITIYTSSRDINDSSGEFTIGRYNVYPLLLLLSNAKARHIDPKIESRSLDSFPITYLISLNYFYFNLRKLFDKNYFNYIFIFKNLI